MRPLSQRFGVRAAPERVQGAAPGMRLCLDSTSVARGAYETETWCADRPPACACRRRTGSSTGHARWLSDATDFVPLCGRRLAPFSGPGVRRSMPQSSRCETCGLAQWACRGLPSSRERSSSRGSGGLVVRRATPDDALACQAIYAPYVRDTVISLEIDAPSVPEIRDRMERSLETHDWLVLEDGDGDPRLRLRQHLPQPSGVPMGLRGQRVRRDAAAVVPAPAGCSTRSCSRGWWTAAT